MYTHLFYGAKNGQSYRPRQSPVLPEQSYAPTIETTGTFDRTVYAMELS